MRRWLVLGLVGAVAWSVGLGIGLYVAKQGYDRDMARLEQSHAALERCMKLVDRHYPPSAP